MEGVRYQGTFVQGETMILLYNLPRSGEKLLTYKPPLKDFVSYFVKIEKVEGTFSERVFNDRFLIGHFAYRKNIFISGNSITYNPPIEIPSGRKKASPVCNNDILLSPISEIDFDPEAMFKKFCAKSELEILQQVQKYNKFPKIIGRVGNEIVFRREMCDLEEYVRCFEYSNEQIADWFIEICETVTILHSMNIVHRDIKLQNVLVRNDLSLLICDLECNGSTALYRSPKVLDDEGFSKKSDVFALGLLLHELITGVRASAVMRPNSIPIIMMCLEGVVTIDEILSLGKLNILEDINNIGISRPIPESKE